MSLKLIHRASLKPFFQTPADGARTAIYLATDEAVGNKTGGYYFRCKPARSSRLSKDRELAKRLYELSEELVSSTMHCLARKQGRIIRKANQKPYAERKVATESHLREMYGKMV